MIMWAGERGLYLTAHPEPRLGAVFSEALEGILLPGHMYILPTLTHTTFFPPNHTELSDTLLYGIPLVSHAHFLGWFDTFRTGCHGLRANPSVLYETAGRNHPEMWNKVSPIR